MTTIEKEILKTLYCENCHIKGQIEAMINYEYYNEQPTKYVCHNCGMIYDTSEMYDIIYTQLLYDKPFNLITLYNDHNHRLEDYLVILEEQKNVE